MSLEDDIYIERFLNNQLSEDEKNAFLKRMEGDPEFNKKVQIEAQLAASLNDQDWSLIENTDTDEINAYEVAFKENQQLKDAISKAHKGYKNSINKKKRHWVFYVAAAIILILIIPNVLGIGKQSNKELYVSYLKDTHIMALVDRNDSHNTLAEAQALFDKKEYKAVIEILTQVLDSTNNSNVYFYLAISQMELEAYNEAEHTLNKLIQSDFLDAQAGYWYKSLLYLKSDQVEKSKKELTTIIENSYFKKPAAAALLKELN